MEKYLAQMSERDARLIICRCFLKMSDKEIGEILDIKEQNVHTYVRRAKNRLIKIVNEKIWEIILDRSDNTCDLEYKNSELLKDSYLKIIF